MIHMADLCAGWAADGSMMDAIRATGVIPTPFGPTAPTIEAPDDELSWHPMAPLVPPATRRRRRLDLGPGDAAGRHPIDVHFRDTYCGGESWVNLGKEALDGIKQKVTVLTPDMSDIAPLEDENGQETPFDRMSDAEQVILLHRDAARLAQTHAKRAIEPTATIVFTG